MELLASMDGRDCPVCGAAAESAIPFLESSLDEGRLTNDSFSSRKRPEFMSYRMVRCGRCDVIFANAAPAAWALERAYHDAGYSSAVEAHYAAATYASAIGPFLSRLPTRGAALEIGTGTGVFLAELQRLGFQRVVGIEPSIAAIAAAANGIKPFIQHGSFRGDELPPESLSLVCCFQTLEHIPRPRGFIEAAFCMIEPGGMIALITHDYSATINKLLGKRSPIMDIEHLQLFCPTALRLLVTNAGFEIVNLTSIRNKYPLGYWLNLLPLPRRDKNFMLGTARRLGLVDKALTFDVGNLLTLAQKPLS